MILPHFQKALGHGTAEGAEIAGVGSEFHIGQVVAELIEGLFEEGQHLSLSPAVLIGRHHIVFGLFLQQLHHIPDDLRPLLEVCIDEGRIIPHGLLKSGINGAFLSEIPGKAHDLHGAFSLPKEFFQVVEGGVGAAVIHKNNFIVISAGCKGIDHRLLKICHILRFVVGRDDQR